MRYEAGLFQWRRGSHVFFWGGARAVLFRQTEKISGQQHFKTLDNFFGEKIFLDNNIIIAFVAFFPILVALFSILQH